MSSLAEIPGEARCKQLVHQLLTNQKGCTACGGTIAWKRSREYGWCKHCRVKVRPKAGTWFRGSKLSYRQLLTLLWCWQERQSPRTACLVVGVSYTTTARWYQRFRSLLPNWPDELLSGLVEVDESFFGKARYGHQTMVIGAIERDSRKLRLQVITDREQDTLELFLTSHVARQSLILTDAWAGYSDLEFYGYAHERCNHSHGHFGPTNTIENMWGVMKRHLKKLYGCIPTKNIQLTLTEWMARQNSPQLFVSPKAYLEFTLCSVLVD